MFSLITIANTRADGADFDSGAPVALIESFISLETLSSLIDSKMLRLVQASEVGVPAKHNSLETESALDAEGTSDTTDQPSEGTDSTAAGHQQPEASTPNPSPIVTDEQQAAIEFPGLKPRLALALYTQGITSAELLRTKIDQGVDLVKLDKIGRVASEEIKAWADENIPGETETKPDAEGVDV